MMGFALVVNAQSGINSPYSQFGLGLLSDQTSGFNRGMNGVGLGFHEHNQINYINLLLILPLIPCRLSSMQESRAKSPISMIMV